MRLTNEAIMNLAANVALLLRPQGIQHGQLSPEMIRKALKDIGRGTVCSDRTVQMIDNFICDFFV